MGGGGGGAEGEPEFQIAPMIDVLLVMLIFFMSITSAQVAKVNVKGLSLPVSPNGIKKDNARNEAIVNVLWDAAKKKPLFNIDGKEYKEIKQVADQLKIIKKANERVVAKSANQEFRLVIRGDRECNALSINNVLNAAGEAGIAEVSFSVYNKEGG
jgi:biopolymer transport protein ExbD